MFARYLRIIQKGGKFYMLWREKRITGYFCDNKRWKNILREEKALAKALVFETDEDQRA